MINLIYGASHTGKTVLAQKILEKHKIPYLSIDHLKMGLIRAGMTDLTPSDDREVTDFIWPVIREIIKTAVENNQNLTVEGCYVPFGWKDDFEEKYLKSITPLCLIMSEEYIKSHFNDIRKHANDIESRLDDSGLDMEQLISENKYNLKMCSAFGLEYHLIDKSYDIG